MAEVSVTRTEGPGDASVGFTVNNSSGSGEYLCFRGDRSGKGVSVRLSGTENGASFYLGYKSLVDSVIKPYQNSLFTFSTVNSVNVADLEVANAGVGVDVYLIATGVAASTDIDVNASKI